jgi:exodeoxyribonuclease-3
VRVKLATWNVNGIRAREAQVLDWLASERPDVVCLQEIKASPDQVPAALCGHGEYLCHWHGHKGYSGVALLLARRAFAAPRFTHPPFDVEHRSVVAEVDDLVMASLYVPNGGKDFGAKLRFFERLVDWAGELHAAGKRVILAGDLNIAHLEIDAHPRERKPVIGQLPEERALFDRLLGHGLVDVARHLAPDDAELYTWWAPWRDMRAKNIGWRIDYVLASRALVDGGVACRVARGVGTSDHAPVVATFAGVALPELDVAPAPPAVAPPRPSRRSQLSLLGGDE